MTEPNRRDGPIDVPRLELSAVLEATYDKLREIARAHLRHERSDHTLQPTALVHEAYLKLVPLKRLEIKSEAHFRSLASRVMRQILTDYARARAAQHCAEGRTRVTLDEELVQGNSHPTDLLALDQALARLEALDLRHARLAELRLFGGLKLEEIADELDLSLRTIKSEWKFVKAWLARELGDLKGGGDGQQEASAS